MTRKFWNCDGGSPEADLTVADAETGDRSATAETSPAICRPDLSEADAKRLAEIPMAEVKAIAKRRLAELKDIASSWPDSPSWHRPMGTGRREIIAMQIILRSLSNLDAANAKIAALTAERDAARAENTFLRERLLEASVPIDPVGRKQP